MKPASTNAPSPNARRAFLAAAAAAATAGLGGCVVVPYGHGRYAHGRGGVDRDGDGAPDYGPVVEAAPPPQRVEVVPVAPGPAYVWIGGYWAWQLGRHVWIGGRWALPPRRGYGWVPGHWGRHGHGWRWRGGHWRG